jgi:AraC-like DNA-binding protein
MRGNCAGVFTDPDAYQDGLHDGGIGLALACPGKFKASLTHVRLDRLKLLCGREYGTRVAHLKFSRKFVFITFPTDSTSSMTWAGVDLEPGDIVFHSRGEHMYQRTAGACRWGSVSIAPYDLNTYCRVLIERDLVPPPSGLVLRPSPPAAKRLRSLHLKACRLVETKPHIMAHREVTRSLDQDLILALVNCLGTADVVRYTPAHRRHSRIMAQFEKLLVSKPGVQLPTPELCRALGVSQRSLQTCCAEFLGMSPNKYIRLRRLHAAHSALRHANSATWCVADIARRHGFSELGRFAVAYRALFGERPSDTLRLRLG